MCVCVCVHVWYVCVCVHVSSTSQSPIQQDSTCISLLKELKCTFQSITLCLEWLTEEDNVFTLLNPVVAFVHYCNILGLFPRPQECTLLEKCGVVDPAVQLHSL